MISQSRLRRGFTFLEIMMVVVIIGILVALVAPKLTGKARKAQITAAKSDISVISNAMAAFEMNMGSFPEQNDGLKALIDKPSSDDTDSWEGPYLNKGIPKDPWKQEYQYRFPGEKNTREFDLWSNGPDKQPGTPDDIANWTVETENSK